MADNKEPVTMEIINSEQYKRANIRFNGKPAEEIREELKKEGWFYSRNHNVWYPKNDAAENSLNFANHIKETYFPETGEARIITEASEKDELVSMLQNGSSLKDILSKRSDMYGEDAMHEAFDKAREETEELEAEAYDKIVSNIQKSWEEHDNGVGQARDEHIHQFLVVSVENGEAVLTAGVGGVLQTLQCQTAVLNGGLHDGGVLEASHTLTADDGLIHGGRILKVDDVEAVLILQALGVGGTLGAGLDGNVLAGQIGKAGDVGVGGNGHALGGVVVAVGEDPAGSLPLLGDGSAGDHAVSLTCLAGGDSGIPAQALQLVVEALVSGNGSENVHIDTHEIAGSIGVLEGLEDGVGSDDPLFGGRGGSLGGSGRGGLGSGGGGLRLGGLRGTAAGSQSQHHHSSQTQCEYFFHKNPSFPHFIL